MKRLLTVIIFFTSTLGFSQKTYTVRGAVTDFFHIDSIKFVPTKYSIETYDENLEIIYKKNYSLWEKDKFRFEKTEGEYRYVGAGTGNDSGFTTYYTDKLKLKSYIIGGKSDTSFIYDVELDENGNIIREKCIKGGTYTREYFYTDKILRKVHTIFSDTSEAFDIWEHDNENRIILFKYFLRKETDTIYNYISNEYNDSKRMKTEIYGSLYHPTSYEKTITYFNKKGLPKRLEYEHSDEGVIQTRFTVIYK